MEDIFNKILTLRIYRTWVSEFIKTLLKLLFVCLSVCLFHYHTKTTKWIKARSIVQKVVVEL